MTRFLTKFLLTAALLCAPAGAWAQTCDVTVSTCAAAQSAANSNLGTAKTICLNTGNYGTCDFFGMSRTVDATIKSTTGVGAVGYWRIGNSDHLRFESVTGGFLINSCSTWITLKDTVGQPNSSNGIEISQEACPTTVQNITVDGAILDRIGQQTGEGRLSIRDGNTITIKNSQFLGVWATAGGPSDGIQMRGAIRNITIGPGNLFSGIDQNICNANGGAHCDTIQTYGGPCTNVVIEGNILRDSSTTILNESSCDGAFRNNILINLGDAQFHTWNPIIWEHNTLYNSGFRINGAAGDPSAGEIRSNIFHNSSYDTSGSTPCTACVASYNLFTSGCTGTNCITGSPTYVGGAPPPSTWAGWQLAPGSLGKSNAHDGQDRGTLYYGVAQAPDTTPPTTPTSPSATPASATQIDLSWTASTDDVAIAGYNIERCAGASCSNWAEVQTTSGTGTTASNTGLAASTLYRYRIRARDTATPTPNYSGYSTIVQATTNAPAQYTVTPSEAIGAAHGSIAPNTAQSVIEGTTTQFTVTPDATYQSFVGGTCGGSLASTTYTTTVITANCSVVANFIPSSCSLLNTENTPASTSMATQTGTFTYRFSIIPAATTHDIVGGHTNGTWTAYSSYATGVLFGTAGTVTVRNGGSYTATTTFNYVANAQYNVRMLVNVAAHTYSVWVAPDGGSETQIASNYAFRTDQASVTQLNNFAFVSATGTTLGAYVCPIGITTSGPPDAPTNYRLLKLLPAAVDING